MEELPPEYTEHNLPLILLSGLIDDKSQSLQRPRQESGTRITGERPDCSSERAKLVYEHILTWNGSQQPWNAVALPGPTGMLKYRFKSMGRTYTLPPRKAAPLPQSPTESVPLRQGNSELHSPLSPLSPGSPVFPDGVMTPQWFVKHQYQVPCLIIAFFDFTFADSSVEDDKIKADINAAKVALSRSGFRSRFAAILMSDRSIIQSPEIEERLSNIRRATSLDSKTGLFFMPPIASDRGLATFVQSTLTVLQPLCVEYYRELTKHARRKKSRSSVPTIPVTSMLGAAQSLSIPGWNARYEVKQGVFAEYRGEMDVAERHYSQAVDDLCNTDGFFESTPSWSPRWDETRLLCDSIATRIVRCLLWNHSTTTAAQAWFEYCGKMKSLVDRKGKGSHTYCWLAWETRWLRIMAQLIQLAEIPMLDQVPGPKSEPTIEMNEFHAYSRPDKAFQTADWIPPVYLLHHPGYWNSLALRTARARYRSALSIPDEDKIPPGQSPASSVVHRAQSYDTYLVPEPHEEFANADRLGIDYIQLAQITEQAEQEFLNKGQHRMTEHLKMELAKAYVQENMYDRAMEVLVPLWDASSWREERWHGAFEELLIMLKQCSTAVKNAEIAVAAVWEQLGLLSVYSDVDVKQGLTGLDIPADVRIKIEYQNRERLGPLEITFTFDEVNAYAGEPIKCQLTIRNNSRRGTSPLSISELTLTLSEHPDIQITSSGEVADDEHYIGDVHLNASGGSAPLITSSQQTHTLNFIVIAHAAGLVEVQRLTIKVELGLAHIIHTIDDTSLLQAGFIYAQRDNLITTLETRQGDTTQIEVLPKPPKVNIQLHHLRKQYFVGEALMLSLRLVNEETQSVTGKLSATVTQADEEVIDSQLSGLDTSVDGEVEALASSTAVPATLQVNSFESVTEITISITFSYRLDNGAGDVLTKSVHTTLPFIALLEPRWSFGPLLHLDMWPSYFDSASEDTPEDPSGIPQRWKAAFTSRCQHDTNIVLHTASLHLKGTLDDAVCVLTAADKHEKELVTKDKNVARAFELITMKISADDRRPYHLNLLCNVEWSHEDDSAVHTSSVAIPRITMPSSEPRVLCTVRQPQTTTDNAVLQYHLENLSTHFLTFTLTMEASDEFAFSGAKYRALSLAPLSRICVPYNIILHSATTADTWISPRLQVVDSYYQKTLRIQPADPNVKLNREGMTVLIKAIG